MPGQCVILAGGLGTRMWPDTRTVPKALLPVAGRPFAAWQLEWLAAAGIDRVLYCIGHLGSMIVDYVGTGQRWNLEVGYVDEGDDLRGTAGALRLAYDQGRLAENLLVLYGDSWLQVNPCDVLAAAIRRPEPALMTVLRNQGRWDGSNVVYRDGRVLRYAKGLAQPPADMQWIDYGLLAFDAHVIADRVPAGRPHDLSQVCTELSDAGQLAGYEVFDRFYEIGSPAGRAELEQRLSGRVRP